MSFQSTKNTSDRSEPPREVSSTLKGSITRVLDSEEEWSQSADVITVLRPNLDKNQFVADRHRLTAEGYRLVAVKVDGAIVAIASYVITPHPVYHRELQIHDMATSEAFQSKGFGSMLLAELERIANESKCGRCYVNSRTDRAAAHAFYQRNGYESYSTGFVKRVAQS